MKKIVKFILRYTKAIIKGPFIKSKRLILFVLFKSQYYFNNHQDINPSKRVMAQVNKHCFFGYYDISPFSDDERYLLGMQTNTPLRSPEKGDVLDVGYYDLSYDKSTFKKVGETETWCWQQGCRLRWFPPVKDKNVIYNTMVDGKYGSVVKNIFTGKTVHEYPFSLYEVSSEGEKGLTLNFSRLQRLRPGYGYGVLEDKTKNDNCPGDDGVWLTDLKSKRKLLLYSLKELSEIEPHESMEDAEHYINHISINPSGESFLFFHLWKSGNTNKRYIRLFTADMNGKNFKLLNNTGHVSHYAWKDSDHFVITANVLPKKLRYCLYHKHKGFQYIMGENVLTEDGHPSFLTNYNYMITDKYPNISRDQLLLLYKIKTKKLDVLSRFKVPENYTGEVRCDLHPRVSKDGRMICVDCVENNYRAMSVIDLKEVL